MSQFRIDEKISESGSTTVYRAYQETLDRPVLLKVLHQHLASDPVVRERFTREAKACAHLRSDHIVQVYDLTEYNGCPAIVMEYVQGRSLKEVIAGSPADRDQLSFRTAVSILQALSLAHRRGIVHRDIKPGNILLAEDGKIKLTDFGLALVAHSPTVTMEGTVLGTPAYMAPEQIRGERVDERSDFFSLGATLVELLTGERIFEGSTYSECVRKISDFRADHLDRLLKNIPPERLAFLKRLMDPDSRRRYQSAAEALHALGESEEVTGRRVGRLTSPRKALLPLIGLVGVVGVVGLMYFGGERAPSVNPKQDQNQQLLVGDSSSLAGLVQSKQDSSRDKRDDPVAPKQVRNNQVSTSTGMGLPMRDSAKVVFTSNPWAKVYVDGHLVGETPIAQPVFLTQGKHAVTFSNPTFDPILKNIDVRAGRDQVVAADFMQSAGFLLCSVQPWAEVYVDEQYKDTTPLNKPIILTAGPHHIRLHNRSSEFSDSLQSISIKPRDTLKIRVTLKSLR